MTNTDLAIYMGGALLFFAFACAVPMALLLVALCRERALLPRTVWVIVAALLGLFLIGVASSSHAADCTSGQKPYVTPTICGITPKTGDSVIEACNAVLPYLGGTVTASGFACTFTADCGGGPRIVTEVCTPPGSTPPTTPSTTATSIVCSGTCTVALEHTFKSTGNPFILSVADGLRLSGLILLVWFTAWGFKMFWRAVKPSDAD